MPRDAPVTSATFRLRDAAMIRSSEPQSRVKGRVNRRFSACSTRPTHNYSVAGTRAWPASAGPEAGTAYECATVMSLRASERALGADQPLRFQAPVFLDAVPDVGRPQRVVARARR